MRRTLSVVLLVIGGWLVASAAMLAWMDIGQSAVVHIGVVGLMVGLAAPFLLLGTWASPGNRPGDFGITVMVSAAIGSALAMMLALMTHDPGFKQIMPPDKATTTFNLAIWWGLLNLVVIGGVGFLAWRVGEARTKG